MPNAGDGACDCVIFPNLVAFSDWPFLLSPFIESFFFVEEKPFV
jgi:hypothetical protein